MRSEFCLLLLMLFVTTSVSVDPSQQHAQDLIGSAINGYAAILDRIGKIYQILINSNEYDYTQKQHFERSRRKIEREMLKNTNEQEIMHEILNEYDTLPIQNTKQRGKTSKKTVDYSIPIIDDIFGFNRDNEEEEQLNMNPQQKNPQFEYIRRRLTEEDHEDIVCNNNNTNTYDTDYKFKFKSFPNCSVSQKHDTVLHTSDSMTIITATNESILYSPNCEFMLLLNEESNALQIMASQEVIPWWSSPDTTLTHTSNDTLSMHFNSSNGDLSVYNGNSLIWSAINTSNWDRSPHKAPYSLVCNSLGQLHIIDANTSIKWYSETNKNKKLNFRENVYTAHLTDNNGTVLYSMSMAVLLIVYKEQQLQLYVEYISTNTNVSDTEQTYIDLMMNMVYRFNVSVYELSAHTLGDTYIVYDPSLPMVYSLLANSAQILNIAASHTFLCIDNETRYFNVEILPFNWTISVDNYTILLRAQHANVSANYTLFMDAWNPCNEGRPILAQKSNRECFRKYDLNEVITEYNEYSSNVAYANVNMKYIFASSASECIVDILSGNKTLNESDSIVFPIDLTIASCSDYISANGTKNSYFNSSYCDLLRGYCGLDGYYDICLDSTQSLCTCYCPRDKKGTYCSEYRDYDCKLNILNANMTECALMTQEELNAHGRDDYDVTLDGDKPCFFIDEEGVIESAIQLHCYFMDSKSASSVWQQLTDYVIYYDNVTFDYCLGNETSSFALTSAPPKSTLRLKVFNFARIFSDNETYIMPLDINHWSGDRYVYHNTSMKDLHADYKIGGRVYIEYQLWQMNADGTEKQDRINVERRFYDLDHWQMPPSTNPKFDAAQKWFIVIISCIVIALTVYCIAQCNKWCQTLEHEKND